MELTAFNSSQYDLVGCCVSVIRVSIDQALHRPELFLLKRIASPPS